MPAAARARQVQIDIGNATAAGIEEPNRISADTNRRRVFPDMTRSNGALRVGQQQFDYRGRQATMVVVRLRDPQGAVVESVNVFIPGANLWLQVNGPESKSKRVEDTMQGLLRDLQLR